MGLQINTNVAALTSYRNLQGTQSSMHTSLERLSSGLRINRAADDAAGLAISENLRSQVNGLKQATKNAQDGISMVQTAEGAMNEVHSMLQKMRSLTVQAMNGSNSTSNLKQIGAEVDSLKAEITAIGTRTKFNGTELFAAKTISLQVGANTTDAMTFALKSMTSVTGVLTDATISATSVTTDLKTALGTIDSAIASVSDSRSALGATQNRLDHAINNLRVSSENMAASESRIRDTDMAEEMSNFSRSQILQQAGISMLAQANQANQGVLKLLG